MVEKPEILIKKVNEVYVKIEADKHILMEMSAFFTFFVPGYQFVPAFRNKIWDGRIRLLNLQTSQIYTGLLPYIEQFCQERSYTFFHDFVDDEYPLYHAEKFIEGLNIHSNGEPITVREHQIEAYVHAMRKRRALLVSPTASGKSLIIYLIFQQLYQYQKLKGLVIVPNTSLVEQLSSDFADYNNENMEQYIHKIYQGKEKTTDKPLTISTWQSLYKMPKEYFEQFDYVIGDEAHNFKAQSLTTIMTSLINAKYRIGLTGTLPKMSNFKTHKLVLEGLFGTVNKVITTKELIDKQQVSNFDIKCLVLKHPDDVCQVYKDKTYQEEIQYLIANEARNKFIKNLAVSLKNNTLILYQMVEKHGEILYNMIKNTEKIGDRKVFFVHGGTDTSDREEIRRIMEFCNEETIFLDFDEYEIMLEPNENVDLIDNTQQQAKEIPEDDDVDTSILMNKIQTSILKGYVWKKKG